MDAINKVGVVKTACTDELALQKIKTGMRGIDINLFVAVVDAGFDGADFIKACSAVFAANDWREF